MKRLIRILVLVLACLSCAFAESNEEFTPAALIARHLQSIGTPEQRTDAKTRVAAGTAHYKIVNGGAGEMDGAATLVGEGRNLRVILKFKNGDYRGEDLLTDGDRVQVFGNPKRSLMGQFLYDESALLTEGILGGTLGTAWPLLDPKVRSAKVSYEGLKNVEGTELHELKYVPKKKTDLDIRLYFDKETFRHVLTVASVTINPRLLGGVPGSGTDFMGRGEIGATGSSPETSTVRQQPLRFRIEQRFGGFKQVQGLTLPHTCSIRFSAEGYRSAVIAYEATFDEVNQNIGLDPRNFQIK